MRIRANEQKCALIQKKNQNDLEILCKKLKSPLFFLLKIIIRNRNLFMK
jgi:hypothetical protein